MKLSEAIMGLPVLISMTTETPGVRKPMSVGHITGFDQNVSKEVIIKVKTDKGVESSFHASNLSPLNYDSLYYDKNENLQLKSDVAKGRPSK